jgi:alanine dehydrogenase
MEESLLAARELLKKGLDPALLTATQEKPLKTSGNQQVLKIGIPKETTFQETRVPLTPGAVGTLVAAGHQVTVEHNAGVNAQYTDKEYHDAGAFIGYSPGEVYTKSDLIVKVAPLTMQETEFLQTRQTLISAVHMGAIRPDYLKALMNKQVTAIGFEFLQGADGNSPIMRSMSEIAGISSIQIAGELLAGYGGGKGLLLGGVTGVPPAVVTIIGAGTVGFHASKTAIGIGAMVKVVDEEVFRLKILEEKLGMKIFTAVSQPDLVAEAVAGSDVVIGAAYRPGFRTPTVVTEEMVAAMREGSVIIDVSIDQGGCIETSRITSHERPTYTHAGVIHYCVPNIASRVPRTASSAISNILGPLVFKIGEAGGVKNLMAINRNFKKGIYVYHRHITQRVLAQMFNMDFMDIDLLYAAQM